MVSGVLYYLHVLRRMPQCLCTMTKDVHFPSNIGARLIGRVGAWEREIKFTFAFVPWSSSLCRDAEKSMAACLYVCTERAAG